MGTRLESIDLYYSDLAIGGNSNKEYHLQLEKNGSGYLVNFQFGRIGSKLKTGTKTPVGVSLSEAKGIYSDILNEKLGKGYEPPKGAQKGSHKGAGNQQSAPSLIPIQSATNRTAYPPELLQEITQAEALALANDNRYLLQKKEDGDRKQVKKTADGQVFGYNKKGEQVVLHGPLADQFRSIPGSLVFDGEEVGTIYKAFDLLEMDGAFSHVSYEERFETLKKILSRQNLSLVKVTESYGPDADVKLKEFMNFAEKRAEGVVFKLRSAPYRAGRNGQHKKFKFWKTCSAIVMEVNPKPGKSSMSIGLYEKGVLTPVGHTSLLGKPKAKVGDVVEMKYLYAHPKKRRLYQPEFKCIRTDVDRDECTFSQLIWKGDE